MNKINTDEFNKVIKIKFEDFFENFEKASNELCSNLEIQTDVKLNFDLNHTLKNLYKYKKNLSKYEIDYIDENLREFI